MLKANEILKTDKDVQLRWLRNQVSKKSPVFLNPEKSILAFNELITTKTKSKVFEKENIEISQSEVEAFVERYLTEAATKKLINTLRVTASRMTGNKTLQVEITKNNDERLSMLMKVSGLSRKDLINKLIECANWKKPKEEEQLEINL